jgi:hypothetical protein
LDSKIKVVVLKEYKKLFESMAVKDLQELKKELEKQK